jgi:hypothetical protein
MSRRPGIGLAPGRAHPSACSPMHRCLTAGKTSETNLDKTLAPFGGTVRNWSTGRHLATALADKCFERSDASTVIPTCSARVE